MAGFGLALLCVPLAVAASSLREVLTPEEFARSGLQKLTESELAYLSARLLPGSPAETKRGPAARTAPAAEPPAGLSDLPAGEAAFGQEEELHVAVERIQKVPTEIRSQIAGAFEGWEGRTRFELANGQVWQQSEPGVFSVTLEAPIVTIRKGLFGAFYLQVQGYRSEVKVKRVK